MQKPGSALGKHVIPHPDPTAELPDSSLELAVVMERPCITVYQQRLIHSHRMARHKHLVTVGFVVFAWEGKHVKVISARDMTSSERGYFSRK